MGSEVVAMSNHNSGVFTLTRISYFPFQGFKCKLDENGCLSSLAP